MPKRIRNTAEQIRSAANRSEAGDLLLVPVEFFLHGWVHVLLPAETVVYLVLLDLEEQYGHGSVFVADSRKKAYSISRDVYENHPGHAFLQNLRRGHYALGVDTRPAVRVAAAFTELAKAI